MISACECMRDEQNHEIIVCGETPVPHSGSDTGSVLDKNTFIDCFFLQCAILSLKPVEEPGPVMQRWQLRSTLMQPGDILVCNSSKEVV